MWSNDPNDDGVGDHRGVDVGEPDEVEHPPQLGARVGVQVLVADDEQRLPARRAGRPTTS